MKVLNTSVDYPRAADDVGALLAHVRAEARGYEIDPERILTAAVAGGVMIDMLTHPTGRHAFDIVDDDDRSRAVIRRTVAFLRESLISP